MNWIKCEDRLPKLGKMVLLYIPQLVEMNADISIGYADRETADGVEDGPPFFFPLGHDSFFSLDGIDIHQLFDKILNS